MHDYDIPKAGVSDGDVVSASVLYAVILIGIIHDSRATDRAVFVESPATESGGSYLGGRAAAELITTVDK